MAKKPATSSTKPGTEDKAAKKEKGDKKPGRPAHPLVGSKDESVYPFKALPGDYDFSKHAGLKKNDFESEFGFFSYKAAQYRHQADQMDAKAEEAKLIGSSKDKAKARRLLKAQEQMAALRESLEEDGVDVDNLLEQVAEAKAVRDAKAKKTDAK